MVEEKVKVVNEKFQMMTDNIYKGAELAGT